MNPESTWAAQAAANRKAVRTQKPLVHNITNYVVMNFTANILLAAGAAPVMAHAENEVEEMVAYAKALVLNIGTLDDAWIAAMLKAGRKASELGVPVILDPVGAGATTLRTEAARRIFGEVRVSLVRGNASEILALSGAAARTRGVDSADTVEAAAARAGAGAPVVINGTTTAPFRLVVCDNGVQVYDQTVSGTISLTINP
jgi:hydroxyethylthiazole kinase